MRRKDREITDRSSIDEIIGRCQVCRLALCDDGQPYVIPLNFGYDGQYLYFHSSNAGRKLDIIKMNNRVGFEFDVLHEIVEAPISCDWGARYESVVGTGFAETVEAPQEKAIALGCILHQYGGASSEFSEKSLASVIVVRVTISSISGKARK